MENITLEKLKDDKNIAKIEQEVFDLENYGRAAGEISEKIATMRELERLLSENKDLKLTDPELYNKIKSFLIRLKGFFMDLLSDEEVLKLFEKNFLDLIKYNIKYEDSLKNFLFQKSYKERDPFLQKLRDALENSREELGSYLLLGEKKTEVKGYIKNWLQDYNNFLGKGLHLKMDISKYLFQSPNTKLLDSENRNYLKRIFEFYEKTKFKVNDPFGLGSYPLEMFGVEAVGEEGSLKMQFKTTEGEELPDIEFEKTTEEPSEEIIPQEQEVVSAEAWARLEEQKKAAAIKKAQAEDMDEKKPEKQAVKEDKMEQKSEPAVQSEPERPKKEISFGMESVESIKKLNIDIFRRISSEPALAAEKIKSEAAKLIQSNPENIIKAKEMWQQSDLYKLYLEVAQEGMNTGLSVDKVIDARGKMGKETFSKKEFEAVVDLSKVF